MTAFKETSNKTSHRKNELTIHEIVQIMDLNNNATSIIEKNNAEICDLLKQLIKDNKRL